MGDIPNRPFREFDDASTEFSPAPSAAPSAPGSLQMQFLGVDEVQLNWSDAADSELGYIVEESTKWRNLRDCCRVASGQHVHDGFRQQRGGGCRPAGFGL
jgi:hypothetical protein